MNQYALADSSDEPGAQERRITAVKIDWNKGTATRYVAKYISKNIDGYAIEHDANEQLAKEFSSRGPSLGLYLGNSPISIYWWS